MTYTDTQLKQALVKMLPDEVELKFNNHYFTEYLWNTKQGRVVLDTELLHLCWLVEQTLDREDQLLYTRNSMKGNSTFSAIHAPWQQRTIALAKVKGVEIV